MVRKGPVAGIEPLCRLACLGILSAASFLLGPISLILMLLGTACLLYLEGIKPLFIIREIRSLAGLLAIMGTLQAVKLHPSPAFDFPALLQASQSWIHLILAFLLARLFYSATRIAEIRDAATRIARCLPCASARKDVGMVLSLVLGFLPLIVQEWKESQMALQARGSKMRKSLNAQRGLLASFLRRLMIKALSVPDSLVSRAWTGDRVMPPMRWAASDSLALTICLSLLLLAAFGVLP